MSATPNSTTTVVPDADQDFPCNDCGVCCLHMAVPEYTSREVERLRVEFPEVHADLLAVKETRRRQLEFTGLDQTPCGWFDQVTRKCRHHDHKPQACRDFEVGGDNCLAFRDKMGLGSLPVMPR